jgi:Fe-S-cluster containining protein
VRLAPGEPEALAAALGLPLDDFLSRHTRLTRDRQALALNERDDGSCSFLDDRNRCRLQDAKPRQCRDYPLRWRSDLLDAVCQTMQNAGETHVG